MPDLERHDTDILIIGSGGAGLFGALHALQTAPEGTKVTMAVKGLIGKSGCTTSWGASKGDDVSVSKNGTRCSASCVAW